jgi:LysR family glycine cleavage system transcriptional activator
MSENACVSRTLPPLNALRAFDAAGRHLSFSKAALELHVTQGAISRQIRELEKRLGARLFVRLARRVELTDVGRRYLNEVQAALDQVERATREIRTRRGRRVLTISVLPTIASYWLMERLARFSLAHAGIEVRILTSIQPVDLPGGEADLAIRVGALPGQRFDDKHPRIDLSMVDDWRGVRADFLFPDILVPLCAPSLTNGRRKLRHPRDLEHYPPIHTATREQAWPDWFAAQGLVAPFASDGNYYGHFFMGIQAAREGQGVAIAPHIFFGGREAEGLLFPFRLRMPSAGDYHLLVLDSRRKEREIALFSTWVLAEAQAQNAADVFFAMRKTHAS